MWSKCTFGLICSNFLIIFPVLLSVMSYRSLLLLVFTLFLTTSLYLHQLCGSESRFSQLLYSFFPLPRSIMSIGTSFSISFLPLSHRFPISSPIKSSTSPLSSVITLFLPTFSINNVFQVSSFIDRQCLSPLRCSGLFRCEW